MFCSKHLSKLTYLLCYLLLISVGSSNSGRARSDPTHQHHAHLHVHSHSAHQGAPVNYTTMECESPQGSARGVGGHLGGSQGAGQLYPQQSWPGDTRGGPGAVTVVSHSQQAVPRHHRQSPPSAGPHGQLSSSHATSASLIIAPGFQSSATMPPQPGRSVDIVPGGHQRVHSSSDPPQIGPMNIIPGFAGQYGQYPQPQWPGGPFPFTLATSVEAQLPSHDNSSIQHTRASAGGGDESPMVGVVVQQSPVASH